MPEQNTDNARLLSEAERAVIRKAGDLWGDLCAVVAGGPTHAADLGELIVHVHAIQHAVMANAAARAYPDEFRLLGSTLVNPPAGGGDDRG